MSRSCTYKRYYAVKSSIFGAIKSHKKIVLLSLMICFFSIVVAVCMLSNYSESIEIANCIDKKFICFLCGEIGFCGFLFSKLFWLLLCFSIIIFSCFSKLFYLLSFSTLIVFCFTSIFDIGVVIICFSLSGVIFALITLIPLFLLQFMFLLYLLCECFEAHCCNCKNSNFFSNNAGKIVFLVVLSLCINILFLFLIKIISPIFIVIV